MDRVDLGGKRVGLGRAMPIIVNGGIDPFLMTSQADWLGGGKSEQLVGAVEFEILD